MCGWILAKFILGNVPSIYLFLCSPFVYFGNIKREGAFQLRGSELVLATFIISLCFNIYFNKPVSLFVLIFMSILTNTSFQPPNPSITASNCILRFWSFGRFVWKSKKLPNFPIFEKLFTFLFWISWFEYLKVRHVEFSSNLFLVWMKIELYICMYVCDSGIQGMTP